MTNVAFIFLSYTLIHSHNIETHFTYIPSIFPPHDNVIYEIDDGLYSRFFLFVTFYIVMPMQSCGAPTVDPGNGDEC